MTTDVNTMVDPIGPPNTGGEGAGDGAGDGRCLTGDEIVRCATADPAALDVEVRRHLIACTRCRDALFDAARALFPTNHKVDIPGVEQTFRDGETLNGRYEILRFVARGGMGEVYEAHDHELRERVALKTVISDALDDRVALERLKAEVVLARRVTHANVCRILEFGVIAHERGGGRTERIPFLTMEFLEGETLTRRIARTGRLPEPVAHKFALQILAGMDAIHQAGIVHRDMKTENVFLVPEAGGGERAVIMDFGLARAVASEQTRTWSTERHVVIGTLAYMSPEQLDGQAPTPACDVYACGAVLFEMLTGERPFGGAKTPIAAALSRLTRPAVPPSRLVPELDRVWDDVVRKCLALRPEDRYQSVVEVRDTLGAVVAPSVRRAGRWPRIGAGAIAAVLLPAALAVAGLWWWTGRGGNDGKRAGGATPLGAEGEIGCADGTRDGFLDRRKYQTIAACAGGWSVPGVVGGPNLVPRCGLEGGNNGRRPDGAGCTAADLCAEGWQVCPTAALVMERAGGCQDAVPDGGSDTLFFATGQRATRHLCDGFGLNNVHGCGGGLGPAEDPSCAPFSRRLGHQECSAMPPWSCSTDPSAVVDGQNEAAIVTKAGSSGGGVLCCKK
jgi:tRNA A-37 threonylcarbamoyl transferase component Bud32